MLDPESRTLLADFDRRVANTGGIEQIRARRLAGEEGALSVTITGEVQPDTMSRTPRPGQAKAPSFNVALRRRLDLSERLRAAGLDPAEWHLMHLWGPGFGGEAAAGMMVGPRNVNVGLQSRRYADAAGRIQREGVEVFIADLARQVGRQRGQTRLKATATAWPDPTPGGFRAPLGQPFLRNAEYHIEIVLPDGRRGSLRVNIEVSEPPASSAQITIDAGSVAEVEDIFPL
jgi:hypothetical protein